MITKLLLKLWPAFVPLLSYVFWAVIIDGIIIKYILKKLNKSKGDEVIDGEYEVVGTKTTKKAKINNQHQYQEKTLKYHFSLKNNVFIAVIYLSLISAIISLLFIALT